MSKAPSLAPTNYSVTKSEVSQVDFKFRSNDVKKQLRTLLKQVDPEKLGLVKHDVFFKFLELHQVNLPADAKQFLKKNYSKN